MCLLAESECVPKFRLIYLTPVLALIVLMAWAVASPIGSSPDDDFHLVSIWCANPADTAACLPGPTADSRVVPAALHFAATCYAGKPDQSAACQKDTFNLSPAPTVATDRGNFVGAYPPLYYAAMSVFAGPNIPLSIVVMRLVNIVLFVGLTTALFWLLPHPRRTTLVIGWVVSTIPLGLFLIPSNNPSGWAIIGVGTAWIALLGYFEVTGIRRLALGTVFVIATLMAAGSRADAAAYAGLSIAIVLVLAFRRGKNFLLATILPVAMGLISLFFFLSSRQSSSGLEGFSPDVNATLEGAPVPASALSRLLSNLPNVPALWAGSFGELGLGWFDTEMPAVVTFGSVSVFVVVTFIGLSSMSGRKALVLVAMGVVLWALPAYVLVRSGGPVGQAVQPRYLLPLIVVFAGLAVLAVRGTQVRFTRPQLVVLVATLSVTQFIALYVNMVRYIQGVGAAGWNLDSGIEWWWDIPFSPMFVLIIGSAAYTLMLVVLARDFARVGRAQVPQFADAK